MYSFKIVDISKSEKFSENIIKSKYFLERVNAYNMQADKIKTYYSYILLKELAFENFGIDIDNENIEKNEFGKPILSSGRFYFSISHSKNLVAVVVDKTEVSIDVQNISKYNKKIAKKLFKKSQNIFLTLSLNKNYLFTKYWCKLECNIKYYGSIKKMRENLINKGNKLNYKYFNILDNKKIKYICCIANKLWKIGIIQYFSSKMEALWLTLK